MTKVRVIIQTCLCFQSLKQYFVLFLSWDLPPTYKLCNTQMCLCSGGGGETMKENDNSSQLAQNASHTQEVLNNLEVCHNAEV